jgi:flagellin
MPITINNAVRDYEAQRMLTESRALTEKSLDRTSKTRSKDNSNDDVANVKFNRNSALDAAARSTNDGLSRVETARDSLGKISDKVKQLQDLADKASNSSLSTDERNAVVKQAKQLQSEIKDTIKTTKYNNESILNNNNSRTVQTGANSAQKVTITQTDLSKKLTDSGLYEADFSSAENAEKAAKSLKNASNDVRQTDRRFAAAQRVLQTAAKTQEQTGPSRESLSINDLTQSIKQRMREALESTSNTNARSVADLIS